MAKAKTTKLYWPYPLSTHGNEQPMVYGRIATPTRDGEAHTVEVPTECVKNELQRTGRRMMTAGEYEQLVVGPPVEEDDEDYPNPNK